MLVDVTVAVLHVVLKTRVCEAKIPVNGNADFSVFATKRLRELQYKHRDSNKSDSSIAYFAEFPRSLADKQKI